MSFLQDIKGQKKTHEQELTEVLISSDTEIKRLFNLASAKITKIDKIIKTLTNQSKQIGSKVDNTRFNTSMKQDMNEAYREISEVKVAIEELSKLNLKAKPDIDQRNKIHMKLTNSFNEIKKNFTSVAEIITAKEKILVEHHKSSVNKPFSDSRVQKHDLTPEEQEKFDELQELNFDEEILNDRQKDVDEIENMVYNLHEMMVDASKEISHQGQMIEMIANNIERSKDDVKNANKEINQALVYQKDEKNKYIILCLIITFIVLVVVIMVYAAN